MFPADVFSVILIIVTSDVLRLPRVLEAIFDPKTTHIREALFSNPETKELIIKPSFLDMVRALNHVVDSLTPT